MVSPGAESFGTTTVSRFRERSAYDLTRLGVDDNLLLLLDLFLDFLLDGGGRRSIATETRNWVPAALGSNMLQKACRC